jgi:CRP-like cAMP-binding protein
VTAASRFFDSSPFDIGIGPIAFSLCRLLVPKYDSSYTRRLSMPRSIPIREPVFNRLLAALPGKEYQRLQPYLEQVTLSFGEILYEPGEIIRYVYFPHHGIISLLSMVEERSTLEVGIVGNEGMVGIPVFLGATYSLNRALVQGAGTALKMKADAMRKHVRHDGPLPDLIRNYIYSLLAQISQTAACNRFHTVEARLARWLLLTHDRLQSNEFRLTQEFLSNMLGVRREGVTNAARTFQQGKLISYVRGQITILNRAGLEAASCKCYEIVKLDGRAKAAKRR